MGIKKKHSDPIKTILVICLGMIAIYFITKWKWALSIAFIVGLVGAFSNYLAIKIDFLWMRLSWIMSFIVPNILLSVVFFFVLTPLAFLSKLFGKKNQLNLKNINTSLFKDSNKNFDKSSFEHPW